MAAPVVPTRQEVLDLFVEPVRTTAHITTCPDDLHLIHVWARKGMPDDHSTRAYAVHLLERLVWEVAEMHAIVDELDGGA